MYEVKVGITRLAVKSEGKVKLNPTENIQVSLRGSVSLWTYVCTMCGDHRHIETIQMKATAP